jgi:hypothetical protein
MRGGAVHYQMKRNKQRFFSSKTSIKKKGNNEIIYAYYLFYLLRTYKLMLNRRCGALTRDLRDNYLRASRLPPKVIPCSLVFRSELGTPNMYFSWLAKLFLCSVARLRTLIFTVRCTNQNLIIFIEQPPW